MQLKEELIEYGYIRRKGPTGKKQKITSHPFHYRSSEGFDIYVGKNNFQNEELSFKFASGNDWWFHAKGQPGSHVIVKTNGKELPDSVYEEAAALAAYYSKGRQAPKRGNRLHLKEKPAQTKRKQTGFRCLLHQLLHDGGAEHPQSSGNTGLNSEYKRLFAHSYLFLFAKSLFRKI